METHQSFVQPPENFYASKKSSLNLTRFFMWGGAAIGIAISAATAKGGQIWFVALFMLTFIGLMDWFLRKQMHGGKVLVSIDRQGIASPVLSGKRKHYEWADMSEIVMTRVQNVPVLQVVLHATAEHPDKRSFWTGQNPARPYLPLSALDEATQEKLLHAIQQRMQGHAFGKTPLKIDNQIAQEKQFRDRLKSLAPTPWLTYGLIIVNAAIWLVSLLYGAGLTGTPPHLLLGWGGNAASEVQRGEWWRLATAMFLHSGLMHVALNMLGLYGAGITVERIYGHRLFALIYLGSGLIGSALSLNFSAQASVSVGASGAVFGITGALLVALLKHREELPKTLNKQTLSSMGFFILYSLAQGFGKQGIDNAAHVGGLMAGGALALLLPARFDMEKFARSYASRSLISLLMAAAATVGLVNMAPTASVDQRGLVFFADGLRGMGNALQAMQEELQQVKAGKMSEKESDERSRTVFAPMMRKVMADLGKAQLPASDPRQPILTDARRMSALLTESLEMASVFPEGSGKPEPADPQRSAAIAKEFQAISEHFASLQTSLKNAPKR